MTTILENGSKTRKVRTRKLTEALAIAVGVVAVLAMTPVTQAQTYTVLHSFTGDPDGSNPYGRLVRDSQGNLYGTTCNGGANNFGAVFMLAKTGKETILYSFAGSPGDGQCPVGGLVRDSAGNLYGTTEYGGAYSCPSYQNVSPTCGTVFELDSTGQETVLHSFTGADGQNPTATLLENAKGNFYGTTLNGGANSGPCQGYDYINCGTVFEMNKAGTITREYQLGSGTGGGNPFGGVILDSEGNLYGTTVNGGANRDGTVFMINKGFTQESVLYNFGGADGTAGPWCTLVRDSAGNLYGTTNGSYGFCDTGTGCGTVFELDNTNTETTLYRFTGGADGAYPVAGLVEDKTGNFYGATTQAGTYKGGTVYEIPVSGGETTLYDLNPTPDGSVPFAALILDAKGNLYGTASTGGAGCSLNNCGTVFKLIP
jgi:uncharacterized repeat protein (TIGR03803 family)